MAESRVRERKRDKYKLSFRGTKSPANPQNTDTSVSTISPALSPALTLPPTQPTSQIFNPSLNVSQVILAPVSPVQTSGKVISTSIPVWPDQVASDSASTTKDKDLWFLAQHVLTDKEQEAIAYIKQMQGSQKQPAGSVEELISIARAKQDECERKFFKFRIGGHEVILRDVASRIVFWLDKFRAIGDIAANIDPVHTSLPWAGIRFLLQVSISNCS
jgi:ankyrin repeat domain-containing protein 50